MKICTIQELLEAEVVCGEESLGKHVYSAVPMASTVDECKEIINLVKKNDLTYFIAETCYYYPCAIYCREKYK